MRPRSDQAGRRAARRAVAEMLESRRLLCGIAHEQRPIGAVLPEYDPALHAAGKADPNGPEADTGGILWVNRGNDGFAAAFGTQADAARNVVDAAFYFWNQVVTNLNQDGGNSQLDVTLNALARGSGVGGNGGVNTRIGNKPRTSSVSIGGGLDRNNNGTVEDGEGFYIDPNPYDFSEFRGGIVNAFTGGATTGGPGDTGAWDLFSLVTVELQHALGFDTWNQLAWVQDPSDYIRPAGATHAAAANDVVDGPGKLYTFNGGGVQALLTSNNGGSGGTDFGYAVHSARPNNSYSTGGVTYVGQDDTGVPVYFNRRRYLPSASAARMLGLVYGYTIRPPELAHGSFYAVPDRANRTIFVANPDVDSNDLMELRFAGTNLIVTLDIGDDVAGTNMGGLFVSELSRLAFDRVVMDGGGGNDILRVDSTDFAAVTLRGGAGDDFLDLGFIQRNLDLINGAVVADGGSGFDRVFIYDNLDVSADTFTFDAGPSNSLTMDATGSFASLTCLSCEEVNPTTGSGADTVDFYGLPAGVKAHVKSAGGADNVNIGKGVAGVGAQGVRGDIEVQNDPSFTRLHVNDRGNATARTANMLSFSAQFGGLVGLTGGAVFWDVADISDITITTGSAADAINLQQVTERLFVRSSGGRDQVSVGNSASGLAQIVNAIDVGPNDDFVFSDIIIDDAASATGRNYAWTRSGAGFLLAGLPAGFGYHNVLQLSVRGGGGNDNFTLNGIDDNFINVDGNGGFDTLLIDDRSMPFAFVQSSVYPDAFSRFTGGIFGTEIVTGHVDLESVTFYAHPSSTTLDAYGSAASIPAGQQMTVFLGNNPDTINLYPRDAADAPTILSNFGILGGGGTDVLHVRGEAAVAGFNLTLSNPFGAGTQNIFGLGPGGFGVAGVEQITIHGGSGDDAFALNQYTSGVALRVLGNGGQDALSVGAGNLQAFITNIAALHYDGGDGVDTLLVDNSGSGSAFTYTRNVGVLSVNRNDFIAPYSLTMTDAQTETLDVRAGAGVDEFRLDAVEPFSTTILQGGPNWDTLRLGFASHTVDDIRGSIQFYGEAGGAQVVVDDSGDVTGDTLHLDGISLGAYAGDDLFGPGGSLLFFSLGPPLFGLGITIHLGSGADTVYAQPHPEVPVVINAGGPAEREGGDALNLALAGAANYVLNPGATGAGTLSSDNLAPLSFTGVGAVDIDDIVPSALSGELVVDGPQLAIVHAFSEDVSVALVVGYLVLENLDTGELIPFGNMAVSYDPGTNAATHTFPGYASGLLPDGNYRALLQPGYTDLYGNASAEPFSFDFFFLSGDATRDGRVDVADLGVLATNWQQGGAVFTQGDLNYDGFVDVADLGILATQWQAALPATPGAPFAPFGGRAAPEGLRAPRPVGRGLFASRRVIDLLER